MRFLYNLAIRLYTFGIWLASFFNQKARLWIDGRTGIFNRLETWQVNHRTTNPGKKALTLWFHAASLGEFEQGRPVIEKIKEQSPDAVIILTFFSPSGFEIRKDYPQADLVTYLPADTPENVQRFLSILKPDLAVFIKYEFWFNYLIYLQKAKIPTVLISGLFRPQQHFFHWHGTWFRNILSGFDRFFVQNQESIKLLEKHHIEQVTLAGDTRVDRVINIARQKNKNQKIERFAGNAPILVCGSTWPKDEQLLAGLIKNKKDWKFIIAPHEIDEKHLKQLERLLGHYCIRYSHFGENDHDKNALIIDNIGMLSTLYQYGKAAYIGGGFGKGIHNTLEPAAFHLPVIFGPNYHKFIEAVTLVKNKGAFSVSGTEELHSILKKLEEPAFYTTASKKAELYINENKGATEIITEYLTKIVKPSE